MVLWPPPWVGRSSGRRRAALPSSTSRPPAQPTLAQSRKSHDSGLCWGHSCSSRSLSLAPRVVGGMIALMMPTEEDQEVTDSDKRLSMVDEALVAGTIANTNGLLVILAKLVAKGVFDSADLQSFSDSYSKPLDHVGMRENELVTQMQDQMESTLAELMRYLSDREQDA